MTLEQLNKHMDLVLKLKNAQELYQAMYTKTIGSPALDGMPHGSGVSDKTGRLAVELADMSARIRYLQEAIRESATPIVRFINDIEDDTTRMIFRLRFIHGYAWCEVANILGDNYTEAAVKTICYRQLP